MSNPVQTIPKTVQKNYRVDLTYINKLFEKKKNPENTLSSSDLELEYDEFLFKKVEKIPIKKIKKRRRRKDYEINKNPEISFLTNDTKLNILGIIEKVKNREFGLGNKKRLVKTIKQANERNEVARILRVSKEKTSEGEGVIKKIEGILTKIENESLRSHQF